MTAPRRRRDIRLRSNVVMAGDDETSRREALTLVPGEIVQQYKPGVLSMRGANRRQLAENGYYLPCSRCERLAHEIGRDGCADPRCADPPREAAVAAAQARYEDAQRLIALEREELERGVETERADLVPLISPADAVARFLGLTAVTETHEVERAEAEKPDEDRAPPPPAAPIAGTVKAAFAAAAARTGRFAGAYCATPVDNLLDTLTLGQVRSALDQIAGGSGQELSPGTDAGPKFCAAYSSSALAVNTFGAWLGREGFLVLAGRTGFKNLRFETKFPTGLQGNPPNLDVVADSHTGIVAIESKCTEYLGNRVASFQPSYEPVVTALADESWRALYRDLIREPSLHGRVDVGQLVRHYLGLRRAIVDAHIPSATLLYLFWEPTDEASRTEFAAHREDLEALADRLSDATVEFAWMSYPELWAQWTAPGAPDWLRAHVTAVRDRYAFGIP
jgi:hypothetical protein